MAKRKKKIELAADEWEGVRVNFKGLLHNTVYSVAPNINVRKLGMDGAKCLVCKEPIWLTEKFDSGSSPWGWAIAEHIVNEHPEIVTTGMPTTTTTAKSPKSQPKSKTSNSKSIPLKVKEVEGLLSF